MKEYYGLILNENPKDVPRDLLLTIGYFEQFSAEDCFGQRNIYKLTLAEYYWKYPRPLHLVYGRMSGGLSSIKKCDITEYFGRGTLSPSRGIKVIEENVRQEPVISLIESVWTKES